MSDEEIIKEFRKKHFDRAWAKYLKNGYAEPLTWGEVLELMKKAREEGKKEGIVLQKLHNRLILSDREKVIIDFDKRLLILERKAEDYRLRGVISGKLKSESKSRMNGEV